MNYYYNQLSGALGVLKNAGIDLPYSTLNERLQQIAADHGPEGCDTDEVRTLHRQYRDIALHHGLIQRGELFTIHDCTPLI